MVVPSYLWKDTPSSPHTMAVSPDQSEKELRRSFESGAAVDHREESSTDRASHAGVGSEAGPAAGAASAAGDVDDETARRLDMNQKLANPLAGLGPDRLADMGEAYCRQHGITEEADVRAFRLGAVIAGDENRFDAVPGLTDRERKVLERELTHRWSNPPMLYWVVASEWHT